MLYNRGKSENIGVRDLETDVPEDVYRLCLPQAYGVSVVHGYAGIRNPDNFHLSVFVSVLDRFIGVRHLEQPVYSDYSGFTACKDAGYVGHNYRSILSTYGHLVLVC
ncbi:Uncharacterised protein [uncultured archaeon]|nr:Uncharacterised protein [uncultured archaeon]